MTVLGHAELLEGIANNLIDNALRYGRPAGDTQARVTVGLRSEGDEVVLSVIDNGPGLAPLQRDQLLRRWAQGPAGMKLGQGAGLGLAIVSRYAALLGGHFTLEPGPDGDGLCASVTLQKSMVGPGAPHGATPRAQ